MRALRSPVTYVLITLAVLGYLHPLTPFIYFGIGAVIAAGIQVHLALTRSNYEGPGGEEMMTSIAVLLIWPAGVVVTIYQVISKRRAHSKGKTEWNHSNGTWDYPGWKRTSRNANRRRFDS